MDSLAGSETAYKGFARLNRNKEVGSDGGMVKKERHGSKETELSRISIDEWILCSSLGLVGWEN